VRLTRFSVLTWSFLVPVAFLSIVFATRFLTKPLSWLARRYDDSTALGRVGLWAFVVLGLPVVLFSNYYMLATLPETPGPVIVVYLALWPITAVFIAGSAILFRVIVNPAKARRLLEGRGHDGSVADLKTDSLLTTLESLRGSFFTGAVYVETPPQNRQLFLRRGQVFRAIGPDGSDEQVIVAAFREARRGAKVSIVQRAVDLPDGRITTSLATLNDRSGLGAS
jgi:hypothetical protein